MLGCSGRTRCVLSSLAGSIIVSGLEVSPKIGAAATGQGALEGEGEGSAIGECSCTPRCVWSSQAGSVIVSGPEVSLKIGAVATGQSMSGG